MRKLFSLILVLALTLSLAGCGGTVGEIADSVLDAAMSELKSQVRQTLEENKIEVVELKSAFGKLNDDGGKYQFFLAALVKTNSKDAAAGAADTLGKLFTQSGVDVQTDSAVDSPYLLHKSITLKHSDFSLGGYYLVWGYLADLSIELPKLVPTPSTAE